MSIAQRHIRSLPGLSRMAAVGLALITTLVFAPTNVNAQAPQPIAAQNVLPITIIGVEPQGGQLIATGVLGSNVFQFPVNLTAERPIAAQQAGACPILNLEINEIHLSLLGLRVDTSDICLRVTALEGQGLLGDLLCSIANLLADGAPLGRVLNGMTTDDRARLNAGLTTILNQAVFGPVTAVQTSAVHQIQQGPICNILNLSLAPIQLNLLGLLVEVDNCNEGPITVDITAVPGEGLLGDLLAALLCPDLDLNLLTQIMGIISQILG